MRGERFGRPWIFKEILYNESPAKEEIIETILRHIHLAIENKGEKVALQEMRKHLSFYVKNGKDASKVRDRINRTSSKDELIDCLIEYFNSI